MPAAETPTFGKDDRKPEGEILPIAFKIAGLRSSPAEGEDAWATFVFHARGSVPLGSTMHLASLANADENEQGYAYLAFLWEVIVVDERERWKETLNRQDVEFEMEMFAQLVDWLYVKWTGNPLRSRSVRRHGPNTTASTSKAGSRSRASRPLAR